MATNNTADDPVFVLMTLEVTTEMCWKRLTNATTRWIYLFVKKKLTKQTGSVMNIKMKILEKKVKSIITPNLVLPER